VQLVTAKNGRVLSPAIFLFAALQLLNGCALFDPGGNRETLISQALVDGWRIELMPVEGFKLFTLRRTQGANKPLTVYIEGDGRAYATRQLASPDPTPNRPLGLRLALSDYAPNILYLGRPCQYSGQADKLPCHPRYWTTHRLSPVIISALSQAIDRIKGEISAPTVGIIGYSGGGAAASLITARRRDVRSLITIAANLDTDMWTKSLGVSPLKGSLNPAHFVETIRHVHKSTLPAARTTSCPHPWSSGS